MYIFIMTTLNGTILIIGGYGYVGSNFIEYLYTNQPNLKIVNVDNNTSIGSTEDNISLTIRNDALRYTFVKCDMNDETTLSTLLKLRSDINTVLLLASFQSFQPATQEYFIKNNFNNLLSCLDILKPFCKSQINHIIYQSSISSYINCEGIHSDIPYNELGFQTSNYTLSKTLADNIILKYANDLKITTIYPSRIFGGLNQHKDEIFKQIPTLLLNREKVNLSVDCKTHNDLWISIDDLIPLYIHILNEGYMAKKYRITGEKIPSYDIVKSIISKSLNTSTPDDYITFDNSKITMPLDVIFTSNIPPTLTTLTTLQSEVDKLPLLTIPPIPIDPYIYV